MAKKSRKEGDPLIYEVRQINPSFWIKNLTNIKLSTRRHFYWERERSLMRRLTLRKKSKSSRFSRPDMS